jgi:WhiB family redox-sensing transcriptional regulator
MHKPDKPDERPHRGAPGPGPEQDPATSWMTFAYCRGADPEVFFPHDGVGVEVASRICVGCPVREPCLEYALANRIEDGVWGGFSERARRRLLASRAAAGGSGSP